MWHISMFTLHFTQRISSPLYTFIFDHLGMLVYCLLISKSLLPPGITNLTGEFYTHITQYIYYREDDIKNKFERIITDG